MKDLTSEDIIEMNRSIVGRFGVTFGVLNFGNLDFAVEKAREAEGTFRKAAELLCGIARGHPFIDGNKRTAFEAASLTLSLAGMRLEVRSREGEDFVTRIASSESLTVKEAELWIRGHSD